MLGAIHILCNSNRADEEQKKITILKQGVFAYFITILHRE